MERARSRNSGVECVAQRAHDRGVARFEEAVVEEAVVVVLGRRARRHLRVGGVAGPTAPETRVREARGCGGAATARAVRYR